MAFFSALTRKPRLLLAIAGSLFPLLTQGADRRVLLIAGPPSHAPGEHEHNAGVQLLQNCLASVPGIKTSIALNGWPADPGVFNEVDAIVFLSDGGRRHPALRANALATVKRLIEKGVGLAMIHYAIEPTTTEGKAEFLQGIGGIFEVNWSVNPLWEASFTSFPNHPITRGVRPFRIKDEWYYHLRFTEDKDALTPTL
jgi:hypothetical protein